VVVALAAPRHRPEVDGRLGTPVEAAETARTGVVPLGPAGGVQRDVAGRAQPGAQRAAVAGGRHREALVDGRQRVAPGVVEVVGEGVAAGPGGGAPGGGPGAAHKIRNQDDLE